MDPLYEHLRPLVMKHISAGIGELCKEDEEYIQCGQQYQQQFEKLLGSSSEEMRELLFEFDDCGSRLRSANLYAVYLLGFLDGVRLAEVLGE